MQVSISNPTGQASDWLLFAFSFERIARYVVFVGYFEINHNFWH